MKGIRKKIRDKGFVMINNKLKTNCFISRKKRQKKTE